MRSWLTGWTATGGRDPHVIPAKAGIHGKLGLDSRFRGNDTVLGEVFV